MLGDVTDEVVGRIPTLYDRCNLGSVPDTSIMGTRSFFHVDSDTKPAANLNGFSY